MKAFFGWIENIIQDLGDLILAAIVFTCMFMMSMSAIRDAFIMPYDRTKYVERHLEYHHQQLDECDWDKH